MAESTKKSFLDLPGLRKFWEKVRTYIDAKLTGTAKIQKLTQDEYDALETKDENMLYFIVKPEAGG